MLKKETLKYLLIWGVLVPLLFAGSLKHSLAFRVAPMNLEDLASRAQRIFIGLCQSRKEKTMTVGPNGPLLKYTEYTFQVEENLKGNAGTTLTIRQVRLGENATISPKPSEQSEQPVPFNTLSLPEYEPGTEVLLFLEGDSPLGLTSPVASDLAVFDVRVFNGQKYFINRMDGRLLFKGLAAEQLTASKGLNGAEAEIITKKEKHAGPFPYQPFVSLVRKLAGGN